MPEDDSPHRNQQTHRQTAPAKPLNTSNHIKKAYHANQQTNQISTRYQPPNEALPAEEIRADLGGRFGATLGPPWGKIPKRYGGDMAKIRGSLGGYLFTILVVSILNLFAWAFGVFTGKALTHMGMQPN